MPVAFAIVCSVLLLALAALQVALLLGAPLGRFAWGGRDHYLQPESRLGAILLAAAAVVAILVALNGANVFQLLPTIQSVILTFVFAALLFAGFVVTARSPSPTERWVMLPTYLVLAALFLFIAVTGHVPTK